MKIKDKDRILDFIPLDKSWMIRMGVLDLLGSYNDTIVFLEKQKTLNDDLLALLKASKDWNDNSVIDVGESGTLYRFLKFASWELGMQKQFILQRTLKKRIICDDSDIVNWPLKKLLTLDNNSSQWASAAVLLGNEEKIDNPPFKLKLTYEAVKHWESKRAKGERWDPRYDETILAQAKAFIELSRTGKILWKPNQSEDYCFARVFNLISRVEGEKRWPNLIGNESNRFEEVERCLKLFDNNETINSNDHRVVQAIAMLAIVKKKKVDFSNKQCVNKSWPLFWSFIEAYHEKV